MARSFTLSFIYVLSFIHIYAYDDEKHCRKHTCMPPEQDFPPEICRIYDEDTGTVYLRKCSDSNYSCEEGEHNYTCTLSKPIDPELPAKFCGTQFDCRHERPCKDGICVLISEGGKCENSGACEIGTYCNGHFCVPQIKIGETGCKHMYDCVNNASCNITSFHDPTQNTCYGMMSFQVHDQVGDCGFWMSQLCPYLSCGVDYEHRGYYCTDPLPTAKGQCAECNPGENDGSCNTLPDNFFKPPFFLKGGCECSFTSQGTAHCMPNFGDPVWLQLSRLMSKWIESEGILKCNTVERFDDKCMKAYWNTRDFNAYAYYWMLTEWLHAITGAEDCVIDTDPELRDYRELKKIFDNESSNDISEPEP